MKLLRVLSRYIVGIVFIISSFFKAIDPVGVSLKIKEYLFAYSFPDLGSATLLLAVALCLVEFITGVAVLKVIKIRFFSLIALLLTAIFLLLTFFSAAFSLVADCGCFGDVIHLSAWGTFYKNIALLIFCIIVYWQRKSYKPIANNFWEAIYLIGYSLFIVGVCIYSIKNLPPADFTDFNPGTDLISSADNRIKYKTEVIYKKDGKTQKFDLENLPDTTWTYVATNSVVVSGSEKSASKTKFTLKNADGEYVTEDVLNSESPVVFISYYDRSSVLITEMSKMKNLADSLDNGIHRADVYILSAFTPEQTTEFIKPVAESIKRENQANIFSDNQQDKGLPFKVLYSDYKTIITFNRSNGGVTYVNNGTVIRKWSSQKYTNKNVVASLSKDSESVAEKTRLKARLFLEISTVVIIFMVLILRFISRLIYKTVKTGIDTLEEMGE